MANLIAGVQGYRKSGRPRNQEATRLGDSCVKAYANTWHTFAQIHLEANGSGNVRVTQNNKLVHDFSWGAQDGGA